MKKTHRAVLKFLKDDSMEFIQICCCLRRFFSNMRMGLNDYNVSLLLRNLVKMGYVKSKIGRTYGEYCLTEKGLEYLFKLKEGEGYHETK